MIQIWIKFGIFMLFQISNWFDTDLDVSMVSENRWHSWYALVWMGPSATVDIRSILGYMFHALSSTQAWITTEIDRNIPTRFESKQGPVHCALASSQAGFLPHTYLGVSENRQISGNASGFSGVRKKVREDLHRASQNAREKWQCGHNCGVSD